MPIKPGSPPPPKDKYLLLQELQENRTQDALRSARATIDKYDRELRKTKGELRKAYELISHLQHQLKDTKTLSKIREKNVFGAQGDRISISKVVERVAALNEEIFQAAATLGEALTYKRRALSLADLDAAAAVSHEMVGEKMTNILITQTQKPEPEVNPILVKVVLQIFFVKFCVSKIRSWYPGNAAVGEFLSAIYSQIRSTEEQGVSGRWRALTRAHASSSTETWLKELFEKLKSVLRIASWGAHSTESYRHRLLSILISIYELRTVIGEFTSADLDILVYECDRIYNPAKMDDAYGGGKQSSGKREPEAIVGTTGIGLGKVIAETADTLHTRSLIPAKIVLWSTLNKALGPTILKKKPLEITDGANQDGRD